MPLGSLIEGSMLRARLIRHTASAEGGGRPLCESVVKTVRAAAVPKSFGSFAFGEACSPSTSYALFAGRDSGLRFGDILAFDDGRRLRITSDGAITPPGDSQVGCEEYTAISDICM